LMDPEGSMLGHQSQQPAPRLAKHELMDPEGSMLGHQSQQPAPRLAEPLRAGALARVADEGWRPAYPWRDLIKGLVRETMAEQQSQPEPSLDYPVATPQ